MVEALWADICRNFAVWKGGESLWTQISGGKGRPPPTIFGSRIEDSLGYRMVKKIAEKFYRLSRAHQRHRQTTDRQTTDGRPIAYSERGREFTSAKNLSYANPAFIGAVYIFPYLLTYIIDAY